jgi:hypothetical protein
VGTNEGAARENAPPLDLPERELEQGAKTIGKQRSQTE